MQSDAVTNPQWQLLHRRAFDEYYDGLWKAVAGLTVDERRFQATDDTNHIDFLVWHMARNEDETISACARTAEVWRHSEWPRRWGLSTVANGCGFTSDDVARFPDIEIGQLNQYFSEVRRRTTPYLEVLEEETLGNLVWPDNPNVTIGQILGHLIVEQSQHLGQVALIRGLQRGSEFTTSWNNPETPMPS